MDQLSKRSVLMTSSGGVSATQPLVLSDAIPGALVRDVLLVVGSAGLVGLLAQISIHLSFTPVPITGQTLGVLLTSTALGWRRGAAAMVLYALAGVVGVPWFAAGTSGLRRCLLRLHRRLHRLLGGLRPPGRAGQRPSTALQRRRDARRRDRDVHDRCRLAGRRPPRRGVPGDRARLHPILDRRRDQVRAGRRPAAERLAVARRPFRALTRRARRPDR